MKWLLNKKVVSIILFLFGAAMMVACGGGGGGGGGGSTTPVTTGAPTLTSVVLFDPPKDNVLKSTSNYSFTFQIGFTDKEGDVGEGKIYFQYPPDIYVGNLPTSTQTSGFITSIVTIKTDSEDTKTTYVWIKDKAGNESNKLPITLIQK